MLLRESSPNRSISCIAVFWVTIGAISVCPEIVSAHGGHGNEFQGEAVQSSSGVKVEAATAKRLGLKVEAVGRRSLAFGVKATGQIESLPNRKVEVTTPVGGTVLQLLVKPGDIVTAGQPVAVMTSPDLARLRSESFDRRNDANAAVKQAEADLSLATELYRQQQTIADREIEQAQSNLNFAQERATKDQELATAGALPQRTALESETKLTEAKAGLSRSNSRLAVAET